MASMEQKKIAEEEDKHYVFLYSTSDKDGNIIDWPETDNGELIINEGNKDHIFKLEHKWLFNNEEKPLSSLLEHGTFENGGDTPTNDNSFPLMLIHSEDLKFIVKFLELYHKYPYYNIEKPITVDTYNSVFDNKEWLELAMPIFSIDVDLEKKIVINDTLEIISRFLNHANYMDLEILREFIGIFIAGPYGFKRSEEEIRIMMMPYVKKQSNTSSSSSNQEASEGTAQSSSSTQQNDEESDEESDDSDFDEDAELKRIISDRNKGAWNTEE